MGERKGCMSAILVVGGAGYIGSATSRFLKKKGYEVVVLDNLSKGHREAVPEGTVLIEGDLGEDGKLGSSLCRFPQGGWKPPPVAGMGKGFGNEGHRQGVVSHGDLRARLPPDHRR